MFNQENLYADIMHRYNDRLIFLKDMVTMVDKNIITDFSSDKIIVAYNDLEHQIAEIDIAPQHLLVKSCDSKYLLDVNDFGQLMKILYAFVENTHPSDVFDALRMDEIMFENE